MRKATVLAVVVVAIVVAVVVAVVASSAGGRTSSMATRVGTGATPAAVRLAEGVIGEPAAWYAWLGSKQHGGPSARPATCLRAPRLGFEEGPAALASSPSLVRFRLRHGGHLRYGPKAPLGPHRYARGPSIGPGSSSFSLWAVDDEGDEGAGADSPVLIDITPAAGRPASSGTFAAASSWTSPSHVVPAQRWLAVWHGADGGNSARPPRISAQLE
jgi:hypothetical protein